MNWAVGFRYLMHRYFRKWRGTRQKPPPTLGWEEGVLAVVGVVLAIALLAKLNQWLGTSLGVQLELASFGASAAILFSAPAAAVAQPRSLVGGHFLSAAVGVFCYRLFFRTLGLPDLYFLAEAVAVGGAMAVMHITRTFHPPAAATALFAVVGGPEVHAQEFGYLFVPTLIDALFLVGMGVVLINLLPSRRYPIYWV